MKIVLTGGGTGGHFFPIIAVAQQIYEVSEKAKLLQPKIYYFSDSPYNEALLYDNHIEYRHVYAGKSRRYFSLLNFLDIFKTIFGIAKAVMTLYSIYPDIVFGKGGYASFPTLFAAKLLRIPVIIHESDSVPGRTNAWAGKFAYRIAVSYPEAAAHFPKERTVYTGQPVRTEVLHTLTEGAHEYLHLDANVQTLLVVGGSLGAQLINETVLQALTELVKKYQIIHQTGKDNLVEVQERANLILQGNQYKDRYKVFPFLDDLALRMAGGVTDLAISRAGSTIFEIAAWGIPSIIIPITDTNGDHQRKNAFNYARAKACVVIEEKNLSPHLLVSEVDRLLEHKDIREAMETHAKEFYKGDAAEMIAAEIVRIAQSHEL